MATNEKSARLRLSSSMSSETASRSAHTRARGTPRGCRPACRTGRAGGETGSTTRMSARPPTAIGPGRIHASCDAWPGRARCDAPADHAESPRRHSHDRPALSLDDSAVAPVRPEVRESHPPTPGLLASRSGSRQSDGRPAARHGRRISGGACSRAWPDQLDWDRSAPRHTPRARSNYRPLPATNQFDPDAPAHRVAQSGSDPKCPPVASRARDASTSSPTRTQVPAGASARECHCEGRKQCR
jgi:hypothetical protein